MNKSVAITFRNILDTEYVGKLREWRNQDYVRWNMVNHDFIGEAEHAAYIEFLRTSKTNKVFLAFNHEEPIAVISIKINWEEGYIEPGMYIVNENNLGRGFGIIMSYIHYEYIFELMPEGQMRKIILNENKTNINLQKKMGCAFEKYIQVQSKNGAPEQASVFYLTKEMWDAGKGSIEEKIDKNFGLHNISKINIV